MHELRTMLKGHIRQMLCLTTARPSIAQMVVVLKLVICFQATAHSTALIGLPVRRELQVASIGVCVELLQLETARHNMA